MGATNCHVAHCADNCERSVNEVSVDVWAEGRHQGPSQAPTPSRSVDLREPFTVELFTGWYGEKGQIGISVSADDDPSYVTITSVWERGLMATWNEDNHSQKQVRAGDAIISADGVVGDSFLIMDAIFNDELWVNVDVLVLVICPKQKLDKWVGDEPLDFYNLPNYRCPFEQADQAELAQDVAGMLPPDAIIGAYTEFDPYVPFGEETIFEGDEYPVDMANNQDGYRHLLPDNVIDPEDELYSARISAR